MGDSTVKVEDSAEQRQGGGGGGSGWEWLYKKKISTEDLSRTVLQSTDSAIRSARSLQHNSSKLFQSLQVGFIFLLKCCCLPACLQTFFFHSILICFFLPELLYPCTCIVLYSYPAASVSIFPKIIYQNKRFCRAKTFVTCLCLRWLVIHSITSKLNCG